jgi:AraC-like DNA-binding protein
VARAAELLRTTRRSVTDIAFDVGFSSSQYFATVFRRYTTLSPAEYRHPPRRKRRRFLPQENLHAAGPATMTRGGRTLLPPLLPVARGE